MADLDQLRLAVGTEGPKHPRAPAPARHAPVKLPPMCAPLTRCQASWTMFDKYGKPYDAGVELGPALPSARAPIGWAGVRVHWMFERRCVRNHDLIQELVDRNERGGETWRVYPCVECEAERDLSDRRH